ncbi:MAG: hypothetical protein Q7T55_25330 [Solirubrobacteraceae bacterium]|nr:hypothetical protein [Solirubrobacteraceae bacterium]
MIRRVAPPVPGLLHAARRAFLACGLVATVAGLLPSSAAAAPYAITRCTYAKLPTAPAGTRAPISTAVGTVPNDLCGDGFGYRFDFSNHTLNTSKGSRAGVRFTLPDSTPDLTILSVSARVTLLAKTGDSASSGNLAFVDETNGGVSAAVASWGGGATPQLGPSDLTTPSTWKPSRSILFGATCASTCTFAGGTNRDLKIEKLSFVLDDPSPPSDPTFIATGLLAPGPVQGTQTLSVTASDNGSGVDRVEVLTPAGALLATTVPADGCKPNYAETCPPVRSADLAIDTTRLLPGTQRLSVRITNAAGLSRTVDTPAFTIPSPAVPKPPAAPNGDSLGGAVLTATKGSAGTKAKTTVAYGHTLRLQGRLLNRSKAPMAGVELDVLETPTTPGATASVIAMVTTDRRGAYRYRYTAKAPAKVSVAYARHRGAGDYETARPLAVSVLPDVTLRAKRRTVRRGAKATFAGRVAFDPQPAAGVPIGIQVLRGGRWATVDVVMLGDGGRFTWTYRFGARGPYRFRARTFPSTSLPASTSLSTPLRVR